MNEEQTQSDATVGEEPATESNSIRKQIRMDDSAEFREAETDTEDNTVVSPPSKMKTISISESTELSPLAQEEDSDSEPTENILPSLTIDDVSEQYEPEEDKLPDLSALDGGSLSVLKSISIGDTFEVPSDDDEEDEDTTGNEPEPVTDEAPDPLPVESDQTDEPETAPPTAEEAKPEPAAEPLVEEDDAPSINAITAALKIAGKRPRAPFLYRIGMVLTTVSLLVSGGLYLAVTVAALGGSISAGVLSYRAFHDAEIAIPIAAGMAAISAVCGVLFLLVVKPLVVRRRKRAKPHVVTRDDEPDLFRFVDRVSELLQAPKPKEIHLTAYAEAAAGFGGLTGFLTNRFTLTLGMPLVLGMKLPELANVIAHEIGHFSQGLGMRVMYIGASINGWFVNSIYGRDMLDRFVDRRLERLRFPPLRWFFGIFYLLFMIPRWILWLQVLGSRFFGSFFLRQMEYHADRCAAALTGPDSLRRTLFHVILLNRAEQLAFYGLQSAYHEGTLGDDLPRFIALNQKLIKPDERNEIWKDLLKVKPRFLATHPTFKQRIERIEKLDSDASFDLNAPCFSLVKDLRKRSKAITMAEYKLRLGRKLKNRKLVITDKVAEDLERTVLAHNALERYFQNVLSFYRVYAIDPRKLKVEGDFSGTRNMIMRLREKMELSAKSALAASKRFSEGYDFFKRAKFAERLGEFNLTGLVPYVLGIDPKGKNWVSLREVIGNMHEMGKERMNKNRSAIQDFEDAAKERLMVDLALLTKTEIASSIPNGEALKGEVKKLLDTLLLLNKTYPQLIEVDNDLFMYTTQIELAQHNRFFVRFAVRVQSSLDQRICTLHNRLSEQPYPFDHAKGKIAVANYVLEKVPESKDYRGTFQAAHEMLDKSVNLYFRVLGRLVYIAEQVELALGLDPFPPAPELDEDEDD